MSCKDVCIDMDADIDNEFFRESVHVARKSYSCCECRDVIQPGVSYERVVGKSEEGAIWTVKTCRLCAEIRKALVCGSWYYGQLWEHVEDVTYPHFQIDCMVNIPSADARMKLWVGWRAWQAEHKKAS